MFCTYPSIHNLFVRGHAGQKAPGAIKNDWRRLPVALIKTMPSGTPCRTIYRGVTGMVKPSKPEEKASKLALPS